LNKAPDAFRIISEVADELDVPQHVLRFWESRFPQIRPMKRGGGRRYYRRDDVDLLRGIRHLLYGEGYTIRGVQRILREQGPRFVQTVWQEGAPQAPPAGLDDVEADDGSIVEPEDTRPTKVTAGMGGADDVSGLSADDIEKLRSLLDDLTECRRIVGSALENKS
jgi:DNA-binding transcriptional MerR regulator